MSPIPEAAYWVAFSGIEAMGPSKTRKLFEHFGSLRAAWQQPTDALISAGLDRRAAQACVQARMSLDPEGGLSRVAAAQVEVICWPDERYPGLLRHIASPPAVLYVRGELRPEDEVAVAMVGTRTPTAYGRQVALTLSGELAGQGVTMVSGLARGIDAEVHRAAMAAGGRTIAVLGSGLDVIYPREHSGLAREIVQHGALLSEYPLGTKPDAVHFPARNRIVAGLTLGTVVVEAGETSGALITARMAGEQGRDVFAVPGNISSAQSRGTNRLIQDGAKLVLSVRDVLDELNLGMVPYQLQLPDRTVPADPMELALLAQLSSDPLHLDEVARALKLPVADVSTSLTMMELKGLVRRIGALSYVAAS